MRRVGASSWRGTRSIFREVTAGNAVSAAVAAAAVDIDIDNKNDRVCTSKRDELLLETDENDMLINSFQIIAKRIYNRCET